MGYRIVAKDFTVEVDTVIEFQNALTVLRGMEAKHKAPSVPDESPNRSLLPSEPKRPSMEDKMVEFYRGLIPGDTLNLINALYDKPDGLTSQELQSVLNITPGGLGGSLGGVTKAAKPYLLDWEDIVSKPKEVGGWYQLTPSMREIIKAESEKEPKAYK